MDMKGHILAALKEQFDAWEETLASMSEEQITTPLLPSPWSTKDVIAHLKAWQERSIARMEAASIGQEPVFPQWLSGLEPDSENNIDQINAWLYDAHRHHPWSEVHANWSNGFLRFLESGEAIPERDLLDANNYSWMNSHPLAFVLVSSYDHHQEHREKSIAWWQEHQEGR